MNINKNTYKFRIRAMMLMVIAWTITSPVFKTYFNMLPAMFFSIVGIWGVVVSLAQKPLRKNLTVNQLMWLLIGVDVLYIIIMLLLNIIGDIKYILVFDMVIDGPYLAILIAAGGQLDSYYLSKFKPKVQDHLRATVMNLKQWSTLVGLIIAGILVNFIDVYQIVWLKLVLMTIAVYIEYRSIRA